MTSRRTRRALQVGCLALILAARPPAPSGALAIVALAAAALATLLAFAPRHWTSLARVRGLQVPGVVTLLLLPAWPAAPLAVLPTAAVAMLLVVFLHLCLDDVDTTAPLLPGLRTRPPSPARWLPPALLMGAAILIPPLLPWLLPTPLAMLHELRVWGPVVAALPVAGGVVGSLLLLRALRPARDPNAPMTAEGAP